MGSRLQRGRSYARKGQVISLDVDPGSVTAQVQGSRARPYRVRIGIAAFGKAQWAQIERALAENAWYAAQTARRRDARRYRERLRRARVVAVPGARRRTCRWTAPARTVAVPCKHLAAVFYLLAEAFDEDPFRILAWRGRERDDLLANLPPREPTARPPPTAPKAAAFRSRTAYPATSRTRRSSRLAPRVTPSTSLLDQLPSVTSHCAEAPCRISCGPPTAASGT